MSFIVISIFLGAILAVLIPYFAKLSFFTKIYSNKNYKEKKQILKILNSFFTVSFLLLVSFPFLFTYLVIIPYTQIKYVTISLAIIINAVLFDAIYLINDIKRNIKNDLSGSDKSTDS
jgi:undecaprenyl pyrophosphate phosphatase UppP